VDPNLSFKVVYDYDIDRADIAASSAFSVVICFYGNYLTDEVYYQVIPT